MFSVEADFRYGADQYNGIDGNFPRQSPSELTSTIVTTDRSDPRTRLFIPNCLDSVDEKVGNRIEMRFTIVNGVPGEVGKRQFAGFNVAACGFRLIFLEC